MLDDSMHLDDTKHTSYIYDLEKELKDIDAQERRISFLPDIEKALNAIPQAVLKESSPDKALVPYHIPRSLTVPEEKDCVRRAIMETRMRIAAQQGKQALDFLKESFKSFLAPCDTVESRDSADDIYDPMELDDSV